MGPSNEEVVLMGTIYQAGVVVLNLVGRDIDGVMVQHTGPKVDMFDNDGAGYSIKKYGSLFLRNTPTDAQWSIWTESKVSDTWKATYAGPAGPGWGDEYGCDMPNEDDAFCAIVLYEDRWSIITPNSDPCVMKEYAHTR